MPKPYYKTTNWRQYNDSLINRGSLTFWIDEEAIAEWKQPKQGKRGRQQLFSDLAITTALMVKRVFSLPLRALQGFIDSAFRLANVPLVCPHYTCISRRAKNVEVCFKASMRGTIQHLAIDATGLKVYGEDEWKVKKHGTDGKRRVWRKLHLAGLEQRIKSTALKKGLRANFIGYADDFVVTSSSKEVLENDIKPLIAEFLAKRDLTLSEEKTHITHINDVFHFLGFNHRKYKGKLLIKPSKSNVFSFLRNLRGLIKKHATMPVNDLIKLINPTRLGELLSSLGCKTSVRLYWAQTIPSTMALSCEASSY